MAGENLGSVYYTVDADTTGMMKIKTDTVSSVGAIEKNLKRVDTQVTKTSKAVTSGMKKGQQAAQNFGYQIQDISVQLAGGQSPFLVLAQQLPQMLTGMGAAAAGIGALIAITGGLALAFSDTTTKLDRFQKAIESMQASITLSAGGVAEYTEQMKVLAGLSETLARIKIASLIGEQKQAFKDGAEALSDYAQDMTGFVRGFGSFESVVSGLTGKKLGKEGFDEAAESVKALRFAVGEFRVDQSVDSVNSLELALKRMSDAGAANTKEGRALIDRGLELVAAYRAGELTLKSLNEALEDNSIISGEAAAKMASQKAAVMSLVEALKLESDTLGVSDRAKALHVAKLNEATDAQLKEINSYYDAIEAHERKTKAEKDAESSAESNKKSIESITMSLEDQRAKLTKTADGYEEYALRKSLAAANASKAVIDANVAELRSQQALREELALMALVDKDEEAKKKRAPELTSQVTELAANPLERLRMEQQEKYDLIAEYEALETANHQLAVDARAAADREYESKKMAALEQMFINESAMNELIIGSLNSLQSAATNVFSGMLSQTMSVKEAMYAFSKAIVNELIGSLVGVGIQYVKNAIISESADKAIMTSKLATQATAATTHTAAVAATVAELASLGAAAAFASTAAIPIVGLGLAPGAAAGAAGAVSALGSAAIAAAPIAGMRRYGGYTSPNSLYQVNEGGKPEMFNDGKNDFLMTGSRGGSVTSNPDLGGGDIPTVVNVNNYTSGEVEVQSSFEGQGMDKREVINIMVSQFSGKGPAYQALKKSSNIKDRL